MKAKKRGKRPGLRARSKNARMSKSVQKRIAVQKGTEYTVEMVRLPRSSADYVMEVAQIAEVSPSLVIAVLAANSIYHGRHVPVEELRRLARCREVMEANDPMNALEIFGPPLTAKAEGESGEARSSEGLPDVP